MLFKLAQQAPNEQDSEEEFYFIYFTCVIYACTHLCVYIYGVTCVPEQIYIQGKYICQMKNNQIAENHSLLQDNSWAEEA